MLEYDLRIGQGHFHIISNYPAIGTIYPLQLY
jgi:hypothetical protein